MIQFNDLIIESNLTVDIIMKQFYSTLSLLLILLLFSNRTYASAGPEAQITTTNSIVCLNQTATITFDITGGGNNNISYTYIYKINNVTQTAVVSPNNSSTVSVNIPTNVIGTFICVLTSANETTNASNNININSSSNSLTITVINPTINAGSDLVICKGNTINLNATVTGNSGFPVTYSWSGPNGYTSSQQNPSISNSTGAMTGNYTVTSTIGNCQVQDIVNVIIAEPQITTLNGDIANSFIKCNVTNANVIFNISNQPYQSSITNYFISWGDNTSGTFTTASNPLSHSYSTGSYTISIQMNLSNGCNATNTYNVFVGSSPSPATMALFVNQATGCVPHTTQYTFNVPSTNVDGTTYVVSWGDGSPNETYIHPVSISTLTHIYNVTSCGHNVILNGTTYTNVFQPTVITQNPCSSAQPSGTGLISIGQGPISSFTPNNNNTSPIKICTGQALQLNNTSNFGLIVPNSNGASCINTSPFYWTITPSNTGNYTATGLGSNNGDLNDTSNWTNGSMTPSITFTIPGTYIITLRVKNSCGDSSYSQTFCIESPLSPQFTINNNSGCTPLSVATTNTTNLANTCPGNPTYQWNVSYTSGYCGNSSNWSFTNGTSATSSNPSFNFVGPGTYSITLTTTNSCGSVTSSPQIVNVKQPPTVSINSIADTCQINSPMLITPSAIINSCAVPTSTITYLWSFPSGIPSSSTNSNPGSVSYNGTGVFTISLSVTNECGTTIASNKTFTILPLPTITGIFSTCVSTTSQLTSSTAGTWSSFPSGIVSISTSGLVTGLTAGSTTITFTDSNNCTKSIPFTVNPSPTATISGDTSVCQNSASPLITFTGANGTTPYTFTYTLNGGTAQTIQSTTGNTATITIPTTTATNYTYCLVSVQDSSTSQCSRPYTNTCATVTVTPLPSITTQPLTTQNICVGGTIAALTVSSTGGAGTTTYQWYSSTSTSTTGGTAITGATAATYTPPTFNSAGTYFYYVIVSMNGSGCGSVTSAAAQVVVATDPTISTQPLATQTQCQGSPATQLSVTAAGGIGTYTYQWYSNTVNNTTTGSPITAEISNTYTPPTSTVGTVFYYCEVSQTSLGCGVTSAIATVVVVAAPFVNSQPLNTQTVCLNGNTTALSVTYSNGTGTPTYQWYNNTTNTNTGGTLISGATTATYTPPSNAIGDLYYYCIITFSSGGCTSVTSNTATVIVTPLPSITTQPLTTQNICVGGTIAALTVSSTGGVGTTTYQWYTSTSTSTTGGTAITGATAATYTPPTFNSAGTYYYYVIVSMNGSGCGSVTSAAAQVAVATDPTISTQPLATQTQCQGSPATQLSVTAAGGIGTYTYQWYSNTVNNTTTGSPITAEISNTYTPPTSTVGTVFYYCEVSQTSLGCGVTSAIATVVVVAAPFVNSQPLNTQTVCLNGNTTVLSVTYSNGTGTPTYQWYNNTTNTNTGGTLISGATTTTYTPPSNAIGDLYYYCIITFSSGGCTSVTSNTATVIVTPLPSITTQPLTTQNICVGGTIAALTVSSTGGVGTTTYQWYTSTSTSTTGGTAITGATAATYTPPTFNSAGTYYYYVIVSMNGSGCGSVTSAAAQVVVATDPTISTQPLATQSQCQGSPATQLSVTAAGGIGTYTYQWYSNTVNNTTTGSPITAEISNTYTPPTSTVGTVFYYCEVSQTSLGCGVTSAIATVIIVAAPVINTQPISTQTVCLNGNTTALSVTYSNGTGTPTYQWYNNTTNTNTGGTLISGATTATYTPPSNTIGDLYYYCIITFSSGGCANVISNTSMVTVTALPSIATQPLLSQTICEGGIIAALTVTATGGTGTTTYQWYSNTNNSVTGGTLITGATADNYTPVAFATSGNYYYYVIVNMNGSGCGTVTSTTAQVIVVPDPSISVQPLASQTQCQGSTATPLTVVATGGLGTFNYQWYSNTVNNTTTGSPITGENNDTYTPPTSTVGTIYYYCEVSQASLGCGASTASATVIIVAAPVVSTEPLTTQTVCLNDVATTVSVAYSNGTGTASYQWFSTATNSTSGGTLISGANGASFTPSSVTVGTMYYYCEITFSSGGCSLITSNTAEVVIDQVPIVVNQNLVLCSGDTIHFVPQQGNGNTIPNSTLYTWNLTSVNPNGSISGTSNQNTPQIDFSQTLTNNTNQIAVATYTVTPIATICTGNSFTIEVTVYPKPQIVFSNLDQIICDQTNSSLVNLTSTLPGNVTINWNATIPAGINGGIASGTDTIPVQNLSNTTNAPLTINYNAVGTFNYNGSSCSGPSALYSITVNPTLFASGVMSNYNGYNVSVFGASDGFVHLTVNGGSGVYTYNWTGSNGFTASTPDINGIPAGTYTVTISDGYCAPLVLTFILTQPPELLIQEDLTVHTNLLCFGASNGTLGVQITQGSVAPYSFQLVNSSGVILFTITNTNALNAIFNGLLADTYSIRVIDANGGVKTLTGIILTQPLDITITASTTPITCYGANNASITLTVTGGTAPYQAQWDNLATGFYQNNLSAGSYTITVTDANGCIKPITVVIPQAPIFMVNPITTNISCHGAHNGSINLNLVGGIAPVSLTWSDGSTAGLIRNNLGPGTYTATISDGTPCYIVRTFTIIEPQALVVSAITTNALACTNPNSGSINLMVSGGTPTFNYSWSNGATTEDLNNIIADNYMVTVTDANGCIVTAQYSITRPNPLTISVNTNTTANCSTFTVNQNFTAQATGGVPPYNYNWSSGTVSGPNNQVMTTTQNGLVMLTVTDAIGCTTTYSLNVNTPVLGNPSFSPTSYGYINYGIYAIGDPIQFQSVVPGNYTSIVWDFGDGTFSSELNPSHTYTNPNDYYLVTQTVTYPFGCVYVQHVALNVQRGYLLVVPTAFTPGNRDGVNDTFRPVTKGLKNVRLDIYDTWGSLIYSEEGEILVGWDGKIKGINSENGNYYAKVSAETFYGAIVNENQTFVLIK
ncbi:PKD domain-containing protein [Flavobacterium sp. SUN046]|uniref:PKD domain-containing protein n=1 Tax=Flavobacterium sp. SUN046 TaxID=3002440 RepID=UPI002DC02217|nr:PKD domain-containing protein [Flavobacterium sp. SUN046]MEC4050509.1 PKD domain-containing protein [Flavobacterium sp. SUN046]